ncbi:hypothetical protein HD806DRAFT_521540 [Xylariaceae sp. AK1471]|nr:hypothetical protein HD806DRAFT_521540 [Xylariaceae sp. AK1471]
MNERELHIDLLCIKQVGRCIFPGGNDDSYSDPPELCGSLTAFTPSLLSLPRRRTMNERTMALSSNPPSQTDLSTAESSFHSITLCDNDVTYDNYGIHADDGITENLIENTKLKAERLQGVLGA